MVTERGRKPLPGSEFTFDEIAVHRRREDIMSCLCNIFDNNNVIWLLIIVFLLIYCCGNGCGYNPACGGNGCGCNDFHNGGCGC